MPNNVIDTFNVPEVFAEALARVERIGPNRRLVFTVTQPDSSGESERVAVVRLVIPADTAIYVAQMLLNDGPQPLAFECMAMTVAN